MPNGYTTVFRTGSTRTSRGPEVGVHAAGSAPTWTFRVRPAISGAPRSSSRRTSRRLALDRHLGRRRRPLQLEPDLEEPVAVAGGHLLLVGFPRQLDDAPVLAEIDLGAVVVGALGLLRRHAASADLEHATVDVDADTLARNAGQLEDHPRRIVGHHQIGRRQPRLLDEVRR